MCSIFGSFDAKTLRSLVEKNASRGPHSWSIAIFDHRGNLESVNKHLGQMKPSDVPDLEPGSYALCHVQAPTTNAKDIESVHPAHLQRGMSEAYLWHNGIIADAQLKEWEHYGMETAWDTKWLLAHILKSGSLDKIQGSFACALYVADVGLAIFRNDRCPMYVDDNMTVSSVEFAGSLPLKPFVNYTLDFDSGKFVKDHEFLPHQPLFYFGGE